MGVVSSCPELGPGGNRGRGNTGGGVRGQRWLGCGILEKSGAREGAVSPHLARLPGRQSTIKYRKQKRD